jgi:hypothetical protein
MQEKPRIEENYELFVWGIGQAHKKFAWNAGKS